ncbi:unnamed protein product [Chilo suppressalis]|uniref:RING-type domain-containing protein n=1 Tax=Chilo suppressalis TaxID=168631 RepID=A0ABN8B3C1_CHISP|nr:unnamed protein product [Chilo suppressalis]
MSQSACLMLASKQKEYKASTNSLCLKSSSVLSSCRICLSSIFKPALLTCGHKFCENCLDDYWRVKEKPNFLICPLCRAQVYNVDFTETEHANNCANYLNLFPCDSRPIDRTGETFPSQLNSSVVYVTRTVELLLVNSSSSWPKSFDFAGKFDSFCNGNGPPGEAKKRVENASCISAKEEGLNQPSKEFRKNFSLLETVDATDTNKSTLIYFKITMMISIVYYLLMLWLKLPTEDLFRWKLWYKM